MHLQFIGWVIVIASLLICFAPALFFGRRAGKSTAEFFASGRSIPWWLAGLSMVANPFRSDTPNLVAGIVRRQGVAGNWHWWAFTLAGIATVFFYARLWRRSGVMTDLEFHELRYSGKVASLVLGWLAGCTAVGPALFTVGNFLYHRLGIALVLFGIFLASGLALLKIVRTLWSGDEAEKHENSNTIGLPALGRNVTAQEATMMENP